MFFFSFNMSIRTSNGLHIGLISRWMGVRSLNYSNAMDPNFSWLDLLPHLPKKFVDYDFY